MNYKNKYYLLRHGQTIYQKEKIDILYPFPENPPITLTEEGKRQIENVAKDLQNKHIDLIFSSDFLRTKQTAKIIAKKLGLKICFDKRLRDINVGIFHGREKKEYTDFFKNREEGFYKRPPKGECWNDVKKRLSSFLNEIEKRYKNKRILIISHGDPIWLLAGLIKGLKKNEDFLRKKYKGLYPDVGQMIVP